MSTFSNSGSYKYDMKKFLLLILLAMIPVLMVQSCSEEDIVETDAELVPFFELFKIEAEARGYFVDYEAERIEGLIQDIPSASVQGQCFHNEKKPKKVIVDLDYWNNASKLEKEFIIFHELGHCFLNRDHLDDAETDGSCVSIMHSNPGVCFFELTSDNRTDYLDELFFQ